MSGLRAELARAARMLARAGLIEAFGHISARTADGFHLSPTTPLLELAEADVLDLDGAGEVLRGDPARRPKEAPLHAAIYRSREDVGAICRTHSRAAVGWGARCQVPPLVHGLGGLSGSVAVHEEPQLLTDAQLAGGAAQALGAHDCLLLYANGAVCTGETLPRAFVRAWYLEERARVAEAGGGVRALSGAAVATRSRHYEAESERAWSWMLARFAPEAL